MREVLASLAPVRLATASVILLAVPRIAQAEPPSLAAGRRAYEDGDFDRALAETVASLDARDASLDDLRDAHRLLAVLRLILGDTTAARRHADAALALDEGARPPAGAPPAALALFAEAATARRALTLASVVDLASDGAATLRVTVGAVPDALALRLGVRCVDGVGRPVLDTAAPPASASFTLSRLRAGETRACDVALSTTAGLRVRTARSTRAVPREAPSRWPLAVGLGVAGAVVVGVVVGVVVWAATPPEGARFDGPRWPSP